MTAFLDFILHIDVWLVHSIHLHPVFTYLLVFSFVFIESSFFPLAPFFPGDGLLFSIGVLAAENTFDLWLAIPVLLVSGILGSAVAYLLGKKSGPLIFEKTSLFNQKHIEKANDFYKKHGGMAFLFSRFMPIIRALIPLIAGIAKMDSRKFWEYNIVSVSIWVFVITFTGYELGHLAFIKQYFGWMILGGSAISLILLIPLAFRQQIGNKTIIK